MLEQNFDLSFDDKFLANRNLTWLPRVGVNFQASELRTLVLGESVYNWDTVNQEVQKRINKNDHVRVLYQNQSIVKKPRDEKNFERVIFNAKNIIPLKAQELWSSVVYHNLVLRCMENFQSRPKYDDYIFGWHEAFKLFQLLNIEQCVVYGLDRKKIEAFKEVANSSHYEVNEQIWPTITKATPKIMTLKINDNLVKVVFIEHPNTFLSWKKWADFMQQHISIKLNPVLDV